MSTSKFNSVKLGVTGVVIALGLGALSISQAAVQTGYGPFVASDFSAPSTKTRAQVIAEYQMAAAAGLLPKTSFDILKAAPVASSLTREEVRKEAANARTMPSYFNTARDF